MRLALYLAALVGGCLALSACLYPPALLWAAGLPLWGKALYAGAALIWAALSIHLCMMVVADSMLPSESRVSRLEARWHHWWVKRLQAKLYQHERRFQDIVGWSAITRCIEQGDPEKLCEQQMEYVFQRQVNHWGISDTTYLNDAQRLLRFRRIKVKPSATPGFSRTEIKPRKDNTP